MGIVPVCFSVLDLLRTESYLLFYPFDNSQMYPFVDQPPGDSLWELGLDFTVSKGKSGFRGADEHVRLEGKERFKIFGVLIESDKAASVGAELWVDNRKVGVITCSCFSTITKKSMAIARMDVERAVHGAPLEVREASCSSRAIAHRMPFDDPDKKKRSTN